MNGFPSVVILADSNALDKQWPGVVLRHKLRCLNGRITGFPGVVIFVDADTLDGRVDGCRDPRNGPDMDKRAAGYRLSRWTLMSWMVGWPGVPILVLSYDATNASDAPDVLDERVTGCSDPRDGLRCPERTGVGMS